MPPRTARGAPRSRGRGRGRGKAAVADLPPISAPGPTESESESQFSLQDTTTIDGDPATSATLLNAMADEQNDPNSSPVTPPTETPAPTPIHPPPVLHAKASILGLGKRGNDVAKVSKFKPRNIRTNAKEREEREAREREKESAKSSAVAYAARTSRGMWGRAGGGRGRGDAMGRGRMPTAGTASGPFGDLASSAVRRSVYSEVAKRESAPGASRGIEGGEGGSSAPGKSRPEELINGSSEVSSKQASEKFRPEPQYPDDDGSAPRVDIELINQSSDSDDDVIFAGIRSVNKGKGKATGKGGLKPIRLDRKEHKERSMIVNTEPSIKLELEEADADGMIIDEGRSSKAAKVKERRAYDSGVKIKTDPEVIPRMTYTREATKLDSPPSAPLGPDEVGADHSNTKPEHTARAQFSVGTEWKATPRVSRETPKVPVIQTEEDRAEWARHLEDVEILRRELGGMAASLRPRNRGKDTEGDTDMEEAENEGIPKQVLEDGRVYLFQFPPVLPKLFNAETTSNPNHEDFEMIVPVDLTKEDKQVKSEEVIEVKQEEQEIDEMRRRQDTDKLVTEEGAIGKLVLRQSGEVEMVWGGTSMKVGRGIETSFYSLGAVVDGMMHSMDERTETVPENLVKRGKSMAMGEIMGKFVVTPDWSHVR